MRRIDALIWAGAVFALGGLAYGVLGLMGLGQLDAGIWSQVLLVAVLLGWLATYVLRVSTHNMTYDQQRSTYEDAVLQQRLDAMSPEELAALEAELAAESEPDA